MTTMFISPVLASMTILMLTMPLHQSRRFGHNSNKLFQDITRVINEQKIKQKIMRGLNLTNSQVVPLPGSPRDLPTRQEEMEANTHHLDNIPQHQTLTVFSGASGHVNSNSFSFKLHSRVRAITDDIQTAKLVLHLWDGRADKRRGKKMQRRRARQRLRKANCKNKETTSVVDRVAESFRADRTLRPPLPVSQESYPIASQSDANRERETSTYKMKRLKNCSRKSKKGKKQKKARVKIVVRSLMPGEKYKRKVAVKKIKVHRFGKTTLNLRLSEDIIKDAARTLDNTLRLQISCKKCGRHVHLDRIMTTALGNKDSDDRLKTWLNPYRPYLFIKYREALGSSKERKKRALSTQCLNNPSPSFLFPRRGSCCSERIWVTFKELDLSNLILYPEGFSTDVCSGRCSATDSQKLAGMPSYVSNESPVSPTPRNSTDFSKLKKDKTRDNKQTDKAFNPGTSKSVAESGKSEDVGESLGKQEQRSMSRSQCVPLHTRPLLLWYIDPISNDIISREIPDLIQESCGCVN